jgi:hypothetical protein
VMDSPKPTKIEESLAGAIRMPHKV